MTSANLCHNAECDLGENAGGGRVPEETGMSTEATNSLEGLSQKILKEVHAELSEALRGASLWDSLDYFEISTAMQKRENSPFPSFQWLSCAPVTSGGNHYVYIGTVSRGRHNLVFVGKTSQGFQAACAVANECARELGA